MCIHDYFGLLCWEVCPLSECHLSNVSLYIMFACLLHVPVCLYNNTTMQYPLFPPCRLFPIAPNNSRILKEDVVLSGYKVPAGVSLSNINRYIMYIVSMHVLRD